ncbi:zinc finger protein 62-like isoform X2 [Mercenaria mercenaria]|uniref:zinc finger protein 62-like isoform X2 n=1 Tax=Mercenaria mercenaria TaxID=6596 RepID=UPI00234FAEC6|nr:zinc finger protein 62-like isoform X2 [Mercenaria mercenaria]
MGDCRYHITMLVTHEEEDAIRSLFKQNNYTCLLHVLSDETVVDIFQCGFTDVFPAPPQDQDNLHGKLQDVTVVKSEIITVDMDSTAPVKQRLRTETTKVMDTEEPDNADELDVSEDTDTADELDIEEITDAAHDTDVEHDSDVTDNTDTASESYVDLKGHKKVKQQKRQKKTKRKQADELKQNGQWKCDACGNFYSDRRRLRRHYYSAHRDLMPKPSCPVCNEEFETRAEMFKHKKEKQHNTSIWMLKDYYCDACGKHLSRYDSLLKHKRFTCGKEEDEDRNYPCDLCGKLFKEAHYVEAHKERIHFKVEKVCDVCGKVCIDDRALKCHRKRHDIKNKTYKCTYCEKTFFTAGNLNQHVRTHTKEKPYKCPLCNYTSGVMGNVRKHAINVHKQKLTAIDLRKAKKTSEHEQQA